MGAGTGFFGLSPSLPRALLHGLQEHLQLFFIFGCRGKKDTQVFSTYFFRMVDVLDGLLSVIFAKEFFISCK